MITKFKSITNLAVFQDFNWDTNVRDEGNNVVLFKPINIFYGRNYSGKTTLSRLIRALEIGYISDKYENPQFEVCIKNIVDATHNNLTTHCKKIRVFNEDFINENLRFIANSNETITPFAILGGNATIEDEIQSLKEDLGNDADGMESGYYLELKNATSIANTASQTYQTESNQLDRHLTTKALDRAIGIKYRSEKFGDQNYTKTKLLTDIEDVSNILYQPLTDVEVTQKSALLSERANFDIPAITKPNIDISGLNIKANDLVTKSISSSNKIEQLLKDVITNRWVKEGRQIHKDKPKQCLFCSNNISEKRWNELDSHFDEESEKLEKEIEVLITEFKTTISNIDKQLLINKSNFYSKFHSDLDRLISLKQYFVEKLKVELNRIITNLEERKGDILNSKVYVDICNNGKRLDWCWTIFENLRTQANDYSNTLSSEQNEAKKLLRMREVSDFVKTIQYATLTTRIDDLKNTFNEETKKNKL